MTAHNTGKVGVINVDAHLDARPLVDGKAHSGSPFRQLLEHQKYVDDGGMFHEFALQGNQCSSEHVKYVKEKGTTLTWLSQLRKSDASARNAFQSVLSSFETRPTFETTQYALKCISK